MKKTLALPVAAFLFLFFISCEEEKPEPGKISITFNSLVDLLPLTVDTVMYENAAGNPYMITEVQYFISKLTLIYHDGQSYSIKDSQGIHYVDSDLPLVIAQSIIKNPSRRRGFQTLTA